MHKEFVGKNDLANINSIMVFENVNHCDKDAVNAAFEAKNVEFIEKEIDIGYRMSEIAATAVKPFSSDWNPVYESMPVGQDQVRTIISSVSNTLDPQSFYNSLQTQTAVLKFKLSVIATSIIEPIQADLF